MIDSYDLNELCKHCKTLKPVVFRKTGTFIEKDQDRVCIHCLYPHGDDYYMSLFFRTKSKRESYDKVASKNAFENRRDLAEFHNWLLCHKITDPDMSDLLSPNSFIRKEAEKRLKRKKENDTK